MADWGLGIGAGYENAERAAVSLAVFPRDLFTLTLTLSLEGKGILGIVCIGAGFSLACDAARTCQEGMADKGVGQKMHILVGCSWSGALVSLGVSLNPPKR